MQAPYSIPGTLPYTNLDNFTPSYFPPASKSDLLTTQRRKAVCVSDSVCDNVTSLVDLP